MMQQQHPYLDLSVLKETRRFLFDGRIAFICSTDFQSVLWANVAGTDLLGFSSIEELIAEPFTRRNRIIAQCEDAANQIKDRRGVKFELNFPKTSKLPSLNLAIKQIAIDEDYKAFLVYELGQKMPPDELDEAQLMAVVERLSQYDASAAILGFQGRILASSEQFDKFDIEKSELNALTYQAMKEEDRLVKQLVPSQYGEIAVGVGFIEKNPYRFLLIAAQIDEATGEVVQRRPKKKKATTKATVKTGTKTTTKSKAQKPKPEPKKKPQGKTKSLNNTKTSKDKVKMTPTVNENNNHIKASQENRAKSITVKNTPAKLQPATAATSTKPKAQKPLNQSTPASLTAISTKKPVKFTWKTNSKAKFTMISDEVFEVLEVQDEDILNKSWPEVAENFALGDSQQLAKFFNSQDTWSGQRVLWPARALNSEQKILVPIDFAALPRFDRTKKFQGLNGFGIIHLAEAKPIEIKKPQQVKPTAPATPNKTTEIGKTAKAPETLEQKTHLNQEEKAAFDEIGKTLRSQPEAPVSKTDNLAQEVKKTTKRTPANIGLVQGSQSSKVTPQNKAAPISHGTLPIVPTPPKKPTPKIKVIRALDEPKPVPLKRATTTAQDEPSKQADAPNKPDLLNVMDQLPVPILVYRDNKILFASNEFLKLSQYKTLDEINQAGALDALFDAKGDETERSDQMQLVLKDGTKQAINARLQKIDWLDGNALLMAFTPPAQVREQTLNERPPEDENQDRDKDWPKAQNSINHEAAKEEESQFMTRVSHEIRAPLNTIIGFTDLIMDERFGPLRNDKYREYMRDIRRSGSQMLDIINDYLDLSKIQSGEVHIKAEPINLNQLIRDTVEIVQPQANADQIILRTSLSKAVPMIKSDINTIRQVVLTLISNAIKATDIGGQVIISSFLDSAGDVMIRFKDQGEGMDEQTVEYIMEPTKPSLQSQKIEVDQMDQHHNGLGLSLTKAMLEATGAKFEIFSQMKKGTVIEITFPKTQVIKS